MKTVLITGANKGIGFETAKQLAQSGYFVYLGSRDKAKGADAIKKLKNSGLTNVEAIELMWQISIPLNRQKRIWKRKLGLWMF